MDLPFGNFMYDWDLYFILFSNRKSATNSSNELWNLSPLSFVNPE